MIPLPTVHLCQDCGKCCEDIGMPPFEVRNPDLGPNGFNNSSGYGYEPHLLMDTELFVTMPAELRAEHAAMMRGLKGSQDLKPCAWLDPVTKRCKHYEWRPANCRDFVPGDDACSHIRKGAKCVWRDGWQSNPRNWREPRKVFLTLRMRLTPYFLRFYYRMKRKIPAPLRQWWVTRMDWAKVPSDKPKLVDATQTR